MDPFIDVALRFCALIEHPPQRPTLRMLQLALLELYGAALQLHGRRATAPVAMRFGKVEMSPQWERLLRQEHYFEVFDATKDDGVVSGWLYDDVLDIHRDLRRALEQGDAASSFRMHWGAHCADALRALHWKLVGMGG